MIEIKNLTKIYESGVVNDNINIVIPKGSIYGLLGPNGAGKTTLIRMLSTITQPDTGEILINGEPLNERHTSVMGYMPEERGLYKKMSVWEQLIFFAEIKGVKKTEAIKRLKYWLERLNILEWKNKKMEELSKGMAQKIQFLCTIIHEPEILILDEPFSGFDPVNVDLVKGLILELNKKGTTILFSTHRMENVEELCSEMSIIHQGKIVIQGKSIDIRRSHFDNTYLLGFTQKPQNKWILDNILTEHRAIDGNIIIKVSINSEEDRLKALKEASSEKSFVLYKENLPSIHEVFVKTVSV